MTATQTPAEHRLDVRLADPSEAGLVLSIIHESFGARPPVDPPAEALADTIGDMLLAFETGEVVIGEVDGEAAACLIVTDPRREQDCRVSMLRRVSVRPAHRHTGVATVIIRAAAQLAVEMGATHLELLSRKEFPQTREMWESHGFAVDRLDPLGWMMRRELPLRFEVPDARAMQRLGARLGGILRAGDLVIASGGLGAGKTTLTQGLAEGLDVEGQVISPTFVISRIHRARHDGPDLVHVDAYRLGSAAEVDDLDLDDSVARSVTLVEWGDGIVERLSDSALRIAIERASDPDDETRSVLVWGEGPRWATVSLRELMEER